MFLPLDGPTAGDDRKNIGDDDAGPGRALRGVPCPRGPDCDDAASSSNCAADGSIPTGSLANAFEFFRDERLGVPD
jgi:hypothetical protein